MKLKMICVRVFLPLFDSEENGTVTVRDRDTMEQITLKIDELEKFIEEKLEF